MAVCWDTTGGGVTRLDGSGALMRAPTACMVAAELGPDIASPPLPPSPSILEVELRLLDCSYAHLRVVEPAALGRLAASLSVEGQRHPVLVVRRQAGRYALIDGYRRVRALERMGGDTVTALVLGLEEPEALAYCHRMATAGRRSALEEGWLVTELLEQGQSLAQISAGLDRSVSWVSRRIGLSRALPDKAAEAVRRAVVSPHGAMKSLLPLARANRAQCERLCERLGHVRLSTRQLAALYAAWRAGDAEQRERIVEAPLLLLEAQRAVTRELPGGVAGALVRDINAARAALVRAADGAVRAWSIEPTVLASTPVTRALGGCTDAYEALVRRMEESDAA